MLHRSVINHDGAKRNKRHKHSRKRPMKHSRKHSGKHSKRRVNNSGMLKSLKGIRSCAGFSSVESCESNPNCMFTENEVCTPKHKRRYGRRVPTIQYGPTLPKESDMLLADGRQGSKRSKSVRGKRPKSMRVKRSKRSKSVRGKRTKSMRVKRSKSMRVKRSKRSKSVRGKRTKSVRGTKTKRSRK